MSLPTNFLAIGLILASPTHGFLDPAPACHVRFRLRSRLSYDYPRAGVAQRLINLATHPKSMQQDRQLADPLLLGSPTPPSPPASLSVSPPAPPVLPWLLAALGAELSPPSLSVPSSWETCYSSSRVDLLILRDCTASALITGSLTPSVIGDRPSHPISKSPTKANRKRKVVKLIP